MNYALLVCSFRQVSTVLSIPLMVTVSCTLKTGADPLSVVVLESKVYNLTV